MKHKNIRCAIHLTAGIISFAFTGLASPDAFSGDQKISQATYCDVNAFANYVRTHIPRGTPKADVEKLLVEENGATIETDGAPRNKPNVYSYSKRIYCPPIGERQHGNVIVTYDRHDRVWALSATGAPGVLPSVIPEDRSDAGLFSYDDYTSVDELIKTLKILFPLGTPRNRVDLVLAKWNSATIWTTEREPAEVRYAHEGRIFLPNRKEPNWQRPFIAVTVSFGPNESVEHISAGMGHEKSVFTYLETGDRLRNSRKLNGKK